MDSHSAAHNGGTEASENVPNAETLAVTVGTPVSKGPKVWGQGQLLRQENGKKKGDVWRKDSEN